MDQLASLAKQSQLPFYPSTPDQKPEDLAKKALYEVKNTGYSAMIVDAAGRLHLDEELIALLHVQLDLLSNLEPARLADVLRAAAARIGAPGRATH